jgi:predicted DNA binding CopG/RHH family protein
MKKEYNLKSKKLVPVADKFKSAKIAKTFRIDLDLFTWLRQEAERTGIPYQTLLNAKLRESMNLPDRVQTLVEQKVEEILRKRAS